MRRPVLYFLLFIASALGIGPLVVLPLPPLASLQFIPFALNLVAWLACCFFVASQNRMLTEVDQHMDDLGLPKVDGDVEAKLKAFLYESRRLYLASYGFRNEENSGSRAELGKNLRRIVDLAYRELPARAVELALFDTESGAWSQVLIAGTPTSISSQSMLVDASPEDSQIKQKPEAHVIGKDMSFAGSLFGKLRVEFDKEYEYTPADEKVVYLLATQAALLMIDAQFNKSLLRMREKSEESIRAKTGFLANLSHEIRGPLGIILNGVELIIEGLCGPTTGAQLETCDMIKGSADHLLDLVNDVLDYAKVEAGQVKARPVELEVKPLLEDLANVIRTQAQKKSHKLRLLEVDPALGMLCDKRHARQMLINFLTNAVKYTPDGGEITISAERTPGNSLKISVKDTGVGIADEDKAKVFGAFERVDHAYSKTQTGTGLGMSLTRKLAEVNDGSASFESEEGVGSTFWISMPAVTMEVAEIPDNENSEQNLPAQGKGESILLVDHDLETREMLERYLVHQGFEIVLASSGVEVMRVLREMDIELAVVESDLPDGSGEDLIGVIRSNPRAQTVPIIMLSSKAFDFDIERFLKLGVDRCLPKPVQLGEVAVTARRLIDQTKSLQEEVSNSVV